MEELYHLGRFEKYQDSKRLDRAERELTQRIAALESKHRRFRMSAWMRYAAVAVIVLCLGSILGYLQFNKVDNIVATASANAVKLVTLPDGTKVWLNHLATLTYPTQFDNDRRDVELEGEAYFEVTKNARRPFTVKSEGMSVRVLGTRFNFNTAVNAYTEEVSLIEGSVQAIGRQDEGMIILTPGQKTVLDKRQHRMSVEQVNANLDAVWHDNLIPLKNVSIKDIAKILEYFYHVHISFASNVDTSMTYTGVIKRNTTIDSVLIDLTYAVPIHFRINGKNVYLSNKK
jgi:ferric-dicitrate binding protein FerR (iron transport regulator)